MSESKAPGRRVGRYPEATTKKVSISLDLEALAWAQEVAHAEGRSFSQVVSDCVLEARARRVQTSEPDTPPSAPS